MINKILTAVLFLLLNTINLSFAQDTQDYMLGDEQKLEMIVHVFGEVRQPGEFRVTDRTNVLELISKAGGPTQFSSLGKTRLTRVNNYSSKLTNGNGTFGKRVVVLDLESYLKGKKDISVPILLPGDIVFVPRNNWYRWQNIVGVARDISVVASVYWLYQRAKSGN
jgi:hypothetical protein